MANLKVRTLLRVIVAGALLAVGAKVVAAALHDSDGRMGGLHDPEDTVFYGAVGSSMAYSGGGGRGRGTRMAKRSGGLMPMMASAPPMEYMMAEEDAFEADDDSKVERSTLSSAPMQNGHRSIGSSLGEKLLDHSSPAFDPKSVQPMLVRTGSVEVGTEPRRY